MEANQIGNGTDNDSDMELAVQQQAQSTFSAKPDGTIFTVPNMGTKNMSQTVSPTVPCASNLDELHNEYKQYKILRKKDEMISGVKAGTPAYLISIGWLNKYHKFLLYDKFENNSGVTPPEGHFK